MDLINSAKFYRNRFKGLDSEVSKFDHSNWIAMSPLALLGTNVPAVMLSALVIVRTVQ